MADKSITDDHLLQLLTRAFQIHGIAGASLSILSEATGLKRASLYHRFPGGKEDMAIAVIQHVHQKFSEEVLAPLLETGAPEERILRMSKALSTYFGHGQWSCIFDTMSIENNSTAIQAEIQSAFLDWRDAMQKVAKDAGLSKAKATTQADFALMQIQGGLVYARVTQDYKPFQKVIKSLNKTLIPTTV